MKILILSPRSPWPLTDGGRIAMSNLAFALDAAGAGVEILSLNPRKHRVDAGAIPAEARERFHPELVDIDTSVRLSDAAKSLRPGRSYLVERFRSRELDRRLERRLKESSVDVVQLESPFMGTYARTVRQSSPGTLVVLRSLNVEHVIWERLAAATRSPARRIALRWLARRLKQHELATFSDLDAIVPVTGSDAAAFRELGFRGEMKTIPVGLRLEEYPRAARARRLVFLGAMDYMPNSEGLDWFLSRVWPRLRESCAGTPFSAAGRAMPEAMSARLRAAGAEAAGTVDDARAFLARGGVMVVPLLSGGGMRVKIVEAMAIGLPVVSTSVGAEGLGAVDGEHLLVADEPEAFAGCVERLLGDDALAGRIVASARRLVEEKFANDSLGRELARFYGALAASRPRR